jgi:hypothetical protein
MEINGFLESDSKEEKWGPEMEAEPNENEIDSEESQDEEEIELDSHDDESIEESEEEDNDDDSEEESLSKEEIKVRNYKAAVREEREKRKNIERKLQENQDKIQRMENIFSQMQNANNRQQQEEKLNNLPTYEDDPFEYLRHQNEMLVKQQQNLYQSLAQQNQQSQTQQKLNNLISEASIKVKEFAKEKPDYDDAYNYLREFKLKEYEISGFTPQQASEFLHEDEMNLIMNSKQKGENPAKIIYNLSKIAGYNSKNSKISETDAKLNTIEKGMKSSPKISRTGMGRQNKVTLESLASLEGDDFDKAWSKMF